MTFEESAGGVVFLDGKVVILQRRSNKNWILPKGHLEQDETAEEAAVREVFEETHLKAKPICEVGETRYQFKINSEKMIDKSVKYFLMLAVSKKVKTEVYFSFYLVVHPRKAMRLLTFQQDRDVLKNAWHKYNQLVKDGEIETH
ncbi:MAG TPA: NUDIX domain-containing protein [Caldisericia bacterium]|nr:NUDIX domain-containing protein [Caldisericia bacterium]HPF49274.1 NUDIX domain-containing protein [Caldisericia bacterium]HPI84046.1 NUDIX domain-containing protein [Caldisericia bacterium]HPQ93304.1 NUDIX domain-containing protein [Caldisericia bacterium]HRV75314.1 NUDIX domain-containing protein [Caldisericia bacterium]